LRDSDVLWAPYISATIDSQFMEITGGLSREECEQLLKTMTDSAPQRK